MASRILFPNRYEDLRYAARPSVLVPNFFTEQECLRLRTTLHENHERDFLAGNGTEGKQVSWYDAVDVEKERELVLRTLNAVRKANRQNFKFDSELFLSHTGYVNRYQGVTNDFRGWHTDLGDGNEEYRLRKLTGVVQLSRPDEYEGGDLVFPHYHNLEDEEKVTLRQQGSLIIFPAYEFHQINQVTAGDRYSFTLFVSGPPFK